MFGARFVRSLFIVTLFEMFYKLGLNISTSKQTSQHDAQSNVTI